MMTMEVITMMTEITEMKMEMMTMEMMTMER
jgi:hypothetical protein